MKKGYAPTSEFLKTFIGDGKREVSKTDIDQLVALMRDEDTSNRDWATFLMAQEAFDTQAIRGALLHATTDTDANVRAEAVLGLAKRDPNVARPLIQQALRADSVAIPIFEAAEICAHPSLIADLRIWAAPSDTPYADEIAADALAACEEVSGQNS